MKTIINWLGRHPEVVIALMVCVTVAIISAMFFHYDLSFIPALLGRLLGA